MDYSCADSCTDSWRWNSAYGGIKLGISLTLWRDDGYRQLDPNRLQVRLDVHCSLAADGTACC